MSAHVCVHVQMWHVVRLGGVWYRTITMLGRSVAALGAVFDGSARATAATPRTRRAMARMSRKRAAVETMDTGRIFRDEILEIG